VRCAPAALDRFEGTDRQAEKFEFGEEIGPGVTAVEVGGIAPDETALHIEHGGGAIAIADGVIRSSGGGPLDFVPDFLMGDDPETAKAGLIDSFRGLLTRDFDTLLMAHGEPVVGGAHSALREFVESRS
jgi:glyoxylase-like metal-dependent hydrolase (beta-lactamase superfamily II)